MGYKDKLDHAEACYVELEYQASGLEGAVSLVNPYELSVPLDGPLDAEDGERLQDELDEMIGAYRDLVDGTAMAHESAQLILDNLEAAHAELCEMEFVEEEA